MSTASVTSEVAISLFGKVRCAVLALLFTHSDESFYMRQIVKVTGAGHGAVQRELGNLVQAGLITRVGRGNSVYYQANQNSPIFHELRGIMIKTAGVADVLRAALAAIAGRVEVAFIYGSLAKGTEKSTSDADVMVIGEVTFSEIVAALKPAQDQLGREVNPSVFTPEEIRRRAMQGDHFLTTILRDDKVYLIGDERDLNRLASIRLAG